MSPSDAFAESRPPPQMTGSPVRLEVASTPPQQVDGRVHGTDRGVSDIEEVGSRTPGCMRGWPQR